MVDSDRLYRMLDASNTVEFHGDHHENQPPHPLAATFALQPTAPISHRQPARTSVSTMVRSYGSPLGSTALHDKLTVSRVCLPRH